MNMQQRYQVSDVLNAAGLSDLAAQVLNNDDMAARFERAFRTAEAARDAARRAPLLPGENIGSCGHTVGA